MLINPADVKRLGLEQGQKVMVVIASNASEGWDLEAGFTKPMIESLHLTQTMRHGVIAVVALGFCNWASGVINVAINSKTIKGEPKRATRIHENAAMSRPGFKKPVYLRLS
ncbi:MAG: hypothetical protein ACLQMS_06225 [Desulfomonilaceae bacterium]